MVLEQKAVQKSNQHLVKNNNNNNLQWFGNKCQGVHYLYFKNYIAVDYSES